MFDLLCATLTLISALLGVGFAVKSVRTGERACRINGAYTLARSLALAVLALLPYLIRSRGSLMVATGTMLVVQTADALVGVWIRDRMRTVGPGIMALCHLACLLVLMGEG